MRIWIDADAAPRDAKELIYRASKRLQIEVVLVANQSIATPAGTRLIRSVTVRDGANVADQYIVEHSEAGDVVITADIPLAAQLVAKNVFALDPRGNVFDDSNIGSRLAARDFFDAARGAGMELSGPQPYSQRDRTEFASALDRVLTKAIKLKSKTNLPSTTTPTDSLAPLEPPPQ
jgi:uncharacterized protein YaiI (UPF0178 family)